MNKNFSDYFLVPLIKSESVLTENETLSDIISNWSQLDEPEKPMPFSICLIGTPELNDEKSFSSANEIRSFLYALGAPSEKIRIFDAGNLSDTSILNSFCNELISQNCIPLCFGGKHLSPQKTFLPQSSKVNHVEVSSKINPEFQKENEDNNYFYSTIAFQQYFHSSSFLTLIEQNQLEAVRLGALRENIIVSEPIFRDATHCDFHIDSIRQSDAPGQIYSNPNGLYAEEACQLAWFAGYSDVLQFFSLTGCYPGNDRNQQTSHLMAQIIWHFIDAVSKRAQDYPKSSVKDYLKYIISTGNLSKDLVFYQSRKTSRWWCEVPHEKENSKIISCLASDYEISCKGEIPSRWWYFFQRFNSIH